MNRFLNENPLFCLGEFAFVGAFAWFDDDAFVCIIGHILRVLESLSLRCEQFDGPIAPHDFHLPFTVIALVDHIGILFFSHKMLLVLDNDRLLSEKIKRKVSPLSERFLRDNKRL